MTRHPDFFGSTTFDYTLADSFGATDTATITINLSNVDDAVTAVDDTLVLLEDNTAIFDPRSNDIDVDGDPLAITEINGLTITVGSPVSVTTGVVNLEPDGRLSFTPAPDFNGSGSFSYTLSDGNGSTSIAQVNFSVDPVNDAPVAQDDTVSTTEDTAVTLDPRSNDADIDGDAINVTAVDGLAISIGSPVNVADGQVQLLADGRLRFTPTPDFNGTTSFDYQVSDGTLTSTAATVTVNVNATNDAPTALPDNFSTAEDTPVTIDLRANDSDVDGDSLSVISINGQALSIGSPVTVSGGQVELLSTGSQRFVPDADFNGNVSFTYEVSDPSGALANATASITVDPVNDAPISNADATSTPEDTAVVMDLVSNDNDPEGDAIRVATINGAPVAIGDTVAVSDGSVTLVSSGSVEFTPAANFAGNANFTYTVVDTAGASSAPANANVNVTAVNDAPQAVNDLFSTNEDQPVTIDPRLNDFDPEFDALSIITIEGATAVIGSPVAVPNGSVVLQPDGRLEFTPAANFNGSTSFAYTVSDGSAASAAANITIDVNPVNDAPTANDDAVSAIEDTAVLINVLTNDTDPDGDPLQVAMIDGAPLSVGTPVSVADGVVRLQPDGRIEFVPAPDFTGPTSFDYTLIDTQGATANATVNLAITGVNDAPDAQDDSALTNEDTPVEIDVLANDTDPEADALFVHAINGVPVIVGQAVEIPQGSASLLANGNIRFSPAPDFNGSVGLIYTVRDSASAQIDARISVVILPLNDGPIARDDVYNAVAGAAVIVDPRSNDRDPDLPDNGQGITVTQVNGQPITPGAAVAITDGTVLMLADGRLQVTSSRDDAAPLSFGYTIAGNEGLTDSAAVIVQFEAITLVEETPERLNRIDPPADRFHLERRDETASQNELYVGRAVRESQAQSDQTDQRQRIDVIEGQTRRFGWASNDQSQPDASTDRVQFANLRSDRVFALPGSNPLDRHHAYNFNLACWDTEYPQSVLAMNRLLNPESANQVAESTRSTGVADDATPLKQPSAPEAVCSPSNAPSSPSGALYCEPVSQVDPDRFSRFTDQLASAKDQ